MKIKVKSLVLVFGLLALVIGISACGYVSSKGDGINVIPHSADWGFTNCLLCHSDGDISVPDTHVAYTIELCLLNPAGCHALSSYTPVPPVSLTISTWTFTPPATDTTTTSGTPNGTTTTIITTTEPTVTTVGPPPVISVEFHPGLADASLCFLCHAGPEGTVVDPYPDDHIGRENDSCLDDGCHVFEQ